MSSATFVSLTSIMPPQPFRPRTPLEITAMFVIGFVFIIITIALIPKAPEDIPTRYCVQPPVLEPVSGDYRDSSMFLTEQYSGKSVKLLQGAIGIPTVVSDDMTSVHDPRFEVFAKFRAYLEQSFPLAAKHLEVVNDYGLLYTFEGSRSSGPTLLMAHQDVVPVNNETLEDWKYPPFEGHFDGDYIYGRGSADSKDTLVGILEAVEALLEQKWKPSSTLLLAFGFDKEIGGNLGSSTLSQTIRDRYGKHSLKAALDEGAALQHLYGSLVALPCVSEKGTVNVRLDINVPGGHSSAPPPHTGIGIMSKLIRRLEHKVHDTMVPADNPVLQLYRCLAEHSETMGKETRRLILDPDDRRQHIKLIKADPQFKYSVRTSQSVDIVDGGVKINALPEAVTAVVNHHVSVDSSTAAVIDRVEHFALEIAEMFDLEVHSENSKLRNGGYGNLSISAFNVHEPSPVSPYTGSVWNTLAGTTKHIFEQVVKRPPSAAPEVIVAPSILRSSTDTYYYWDLTRSIYRFSPTYYRDNYDAHTTNERILFRSHLVAVAWYYEFMINMTA